MWRINSQIDGFLWNAFIVSSLTIGFRFNFVSNNGMMAILEFHSEAGEIKNEIPEILYAWGGKSYK